MAGYYLTDEQFIEEWNKHGSPKLMGLANKMSPRSVMNRRLAIETRHGIKLETFNSQRDAKKERPKKERLTKIDQTDGHVRRGREMAKGKVIVFSDAHFWPDNFTTAFKALLLFIKEFKPQVIVANGDMFDGASVSRFPRLDWSVLPTVKQELEACQYFMGEIEKVAKGAELIWTLGNHDSRMEGYIVNNAPALEGLPGTSLKDHFPMWKPCYSYWVNEDTCIKHRWKGGHTAGHTNTLQSGVNMITGHTHVLAVQPWSDMNGTRYGVQTGTLADPLATQFAYMEDHPRNWRSGFALLSFEEGRLLMPELVQVCGDGEVEFRGCINRV